MTHSVFGRPTVAYRYYTRAAKLAGLAEIARERDGDLAYLMRQTGLDPGVLKTPEAVIDYRAFCELLSLCSLKWDMPDVGLRMVRFQQIDFLGPVALVTRMEGTVRGALHAITANLIIHSNATVAALEEAGDTATVILNQRDDAPKGRENTELVMAQGKMVIDTIVKSPIPLIEVTLTHAKGASAAAVASHFAAPVRYQAERNSFSFDRALLDRCIERSDQAYHALIKRYLATARSEIDGASSDDVRLEIAKQMELGVCTLQSVAAALRVPPHYLQRRLRAEGTSVRDLVDEWRRARALSLVTNTRMPLSAVSDALGYSEQSVFTQAFRRWFGDSPLHYRSEVPLLRP